MKNMTARRPRNHFVAAPADSNPHRPDRISPTFTCSAAELYTLVRKTALAQPRTILQSESPKENHLAFVQRTKYWRFPDDIVADIIALEDGGATLMLSSKARYGMEDFGVNKRRVIRWLAALEAGAAQAT
ncbi:MAG: hypothetical protein CFH38_01262 [Alphaproteobacteria bacterium MarineAlpha10_Bin1]|jgi:uncharacterized protein (DUF1499 family)|nr:MAG: hypothetical protein CFH38_01262 [Alphaproteobacteria bacterium MarineAlpha10_Bin1]